MQLIDNPPPPSTPERAGGSQISGAVVMVAAVLIVLSLLVVRFFASGITPFEAPGGADEPTAVVSESSPAAERYFGELQLAPGSIDTGIGGGIASVSQVELLDAPAGVDVWLYDDQEGPRIEIVVADEVAPGPQSLVFSIDSEPEAVTWVFEVLEG